MSPASALDYVGTFMGYFVVSVILPLIMSYAGEAINALMRRNLVSMFHRRLFKNDKLLYRLSVDGSIDSIDQRITSDLQVTLDGFCCVLFGNSADYLAYPVLFRITRFSGSLHNVFTLPDVSSQEKQGRIVGMIIASVAAAFVAYILPVNHVAKILFGGQRYEGDFRTTHTRAVLNAEQISTLRGEGAEKELTRRLLQRVDANSQVYYMWQGALLILRLFFTISIPVCSYMCLTCATASAALAKFSRRSRRPAPLIGQEGFPARGRRVAKRSGAPRHVLKSDGALLFWRRLYQSHVAPV